MKLKNALSLLQAYTPNQTTSSIKLDANEANYNLTKLSLPKFVSYNRYPDSMATELTNKLAEMYNLSSNELLIGSGSSELLELIVKSFVNPNESILSISPSFVMYEKYAKYYNTIYHTFPLNDNGYLDITAFIKEAKRLQPTVIFLSSPNNPTGTSIAKEDLKTIISSTEALVVIDEAYIEFLGEDQSMIKDINNYPNLLVARTFSKAYGLASLRVGYLAANTNLIDLLKRVKTPYSVSQLSQSLASIALDNKEAINAYLRMVNQNKTILKEALSKQAFRVFDSDANFLYLKTKFPLAKYLNTYNITIRSLPKDAYRITIPSDEELPFLLTALKELQDENKNNLN